MDDISLTVDDLALPDHLQVWYQYEQVHGPITESKVYKEIQKMDKAEFEEQLKKSHADLRKKYKGVEQQARLKYENRVKGAKFSLSELKKKMIGELQDYCKNSHEDRGVITMDALAKIMDYLERAKSREEVHLIDEAFRERLVEDQVLYKQEKQEDELLRSRDSQEKNSLSQLLHGRDLQEKNSLARMLENKNKIASMGEAEIIGEVLRIGKQERETKRKMFYVMTEEERIRKLHEEAEKLQEAEGHTMIDRMKKRRQSHQESKKKAIERTLSAATAVGHPANQVPKLLRTLSL